MKKEINKQLAAINIDLIKAVIQNNATQVDKLLHLGADPNCYEDDCLIRPAHFAAVYDSIDVIFFLVKFGANLQSYNIDGLRPIDIAIQLKHQHMIEALKSLSTNLTWLASYK